jgi:hypothetical protein
MFIKMETVGCFQATVSYGDVKLKNGEFSIIVLASKFVCALHLATFVEVGGCGAL